VEADAVIELECDAVLFDLDGVLVDSSACVERHWRRWASEHGIDPDKTMRFAHGRPTVDSIRLVAPHLPADFEAARLNAAEAFDTEGVVAIRGAAELVRRLPPTAWAIATSGTRDTALTRLRHTGVLVPDVLITADDITHGKPDPEPYLLAAAGLKVPPGRCVVIEDAPPGISAGRAAGMPVVAVATTHPAAELKEASVIARHVRDIEIVVRPSGRVTLRVTPLRSV
jgi:sugar-phosphatase